MGVGQKLYDGEFGWLWAGTLFSIPDKMDGQNFKTENSDGSGPEHWLAFRLQNGWTNKNFKTENSDGSGPEHWLAFRMQNGWTKT